MYFPHIEVSAFYDINGKMHRVSVSKYGNMTEDFLDVTAQIIVDYEYDEDSGEDYSISVKLNIKDDNIDIRRHKHHNTWYPGIWVNYFMKIWTTMFAPDVRHKVEMTFSDIIKQSANKIYYRHPMSGTVRY